MADTSTKLGGGSVRFGATYGSNRLFTGARGGGGGGSHIVLSRSLGLARGAGATGGGLGLGLGLGGLGLGLGAGARAGGAGIGLYGGTLAGGAGIGLGGGALAGGAGIGLGGGALALGSGLGLGAAGFRAGVAPLRARLGGRVFKIGGYGFNPAFFNTSTTVDAGISPVPTIDPTLPSMDMVQVTRLKEKEELQVLNDKFASFIDKVRSLSKKGTYCGCKN